MWYIIYFIIAAREYFECSQNKEVLNAWCDANVNYSVSIITGGMGQTFHHDQIICPIIIWNQNFYVCTYVCVHAHACAYVCACIPNYHGVCVEVKTELSGPESVLLAQWGWVCLLLSLCVFQVSWPRNFQTTLLFPLSSQDRSAKITDVSHHVRFSLGSRGQTHFVELVWKILLPAEPSC